MKDNPAVINQIVSQLEEIEQLKAEVERLEKKIRWNTAKDWGDDAAKYYKSEFEKQFERAEKAEKERDELRTRLNGRTYYHDNEAVEQENAELRRELTAKGEQFRLCFAHGGGPSLPQPEHCPECIKQQARQEAAREMADMLLGKGWERICDCHEGLICTPCMIKHKFKLEG